jgi:hypothetical protein
VRVRYCPCDCIEQSNRVVVSGPRGDQNLHARYPIAHESIRVGGYTHFHSFACAQSVWQSMALDIALSYRYRVFVGASCDVRLECAVASRCPKSCAGFFVGSLSGRTA